MKTPKRAVATKLNIYFSELKRGISAHFNPKQLTIDRQVGYAEHATNKGDCPELEFTGSAGRTLKLELFFDTYESGENVQTAYIERLEEGALVMGNGMGQYPPTCVVNWGKEQRKFVGVIQSLSVNYTMFFGDGTPCRATASLTLKEPDRDVRAVAHRRFEKRTEFDRATAYARYMTARDSRLTAERVPTPDAIAKARAKASGIPQAKARR